MNNGIGVKIHSRKNIWFKHLDDESTIRFVSHIFEAAVVNYPVMHLNAMDTNYKLKAELVPNAIGEAYFANALCIALENHHD
jgi:hypothetical protein